MRFILCAMLILAWTSGPYFGPKTPTLPAPPTLAPAVETVAPPVDFDSLHAQARNALVQLRQSQAEDHMTVASAKGF